jgi:hypothetical protein
MPSARAAALNPVTTASTPREASSPSSAVARAAFFASSANARNDAMTPPPSTAALVARDCSAASTLTGIAVTSSP